MTDDDEPNLVTSSKSTTVVADGYKFAIDIYRLETDQAWSLEVVDQEGCSHVWDDLFASDIEARNAALHAIETEGAITFMKGSNVVPFRR